MDDLLFRMMELKAKGFYCSQIMMLLALENQDKTNDDLIRSMSGLAFGIGIGDACGALTGGACILSLYAGKGTEEEEEHFRLKGMLHELGEWFIETYTGQYGGISCDAISEEGALRNERCGGVVAATYQKVLEILVENDFDPSEGR
ncbi:MAG TPA: C-GCAxxG-C-C family protein [Geobacteraceae bacterium]|nr:C-GCAxxG-C-C family protein [Geobacteraceae bacterium]